MIKVWDASRRQYVTVASNRGDKLYTKSIDFNGDGVGGYDGDTSLVTIDEALEQLKDYAVENRRGLAWMMKNGTLGGGGNGSGGGGGQVGALKFNVQVQGQTIDSDAIYVNDKSDVTVSFGIGGTYVGKPMSISIKDDKGNVYGGYDNTTFTVKAGMTNILVPSIRESIVLTFSGYDMETLNTIESYSLAINVANLKVTANEAMTVTQSAEEFNIAYRITTNEGQNTDITLKLIANGETYTWNRFAALGKYYTSNSNDTFNIYKLFSEQDIAEKVVRGQLMSMTVIATVTAGNFSSSCTTSITVTSPDRVTIDITPLGDIYGDVPTCEYIESDNITITTKLYYSTNEYTMYYAFFQMKDGVEYSEDIAFGMADNDIAINTDNCNVLMSNNQPGFPSNVPMQNMVNETTYFTQTYSAVISYGSLAGIDADKPVYVYVVAWDRNEPEKTRGTRCKWFRVARNSEWSPWNPVLSGKDDYDEKLNYLYYYWNQDTINTVSGNRWVSEREYKGSSETAKTISGYIEYFNANNVTNGLIRNTNNPNSMPCNSFRMSSGSYGILRKSDGTEFRPFDGGENNWFFKNSGGDGWTFSILYKTDTQPDTDNVVCSYATFDNATGEFTEGIYITTDHVYVKVVATDGAVLSIDKILSQNMLNQIDIVFKPGTGDNSSDESMCELKLYVNGKMTEAAMNRNGFYEFGNSKKVTSIQNPFVFGARYHRGQYINQGDTHFYRIMFYKRWLTDYHIVKNYIQGRAEVDKVYVQGSGWTTDMAANNALRTKNFFDLDRNGLNKLIDNSVTNMKEKCEPKAKIFESIISSGTNPLPVFVAEIDETIADEFRGFVTARYSEDEKKTLASKHYPANFRIYPEYTATPFEFGPDLSTGVSFSEDKPWITLQGTTTLGYGSKNYQIGFGSDNTHPHLVQMFEDMLPENQWILKADVVDSGHANNAAIGKFINEFYSRYPSDFTNRALENIDNNYRTELKQTTQGHPVLMFIKFGNREPEMVGIYSLNLGRISTYNLGYDVFNGYYKVRSRVDGQDYPVSYVNHRVTNDNIKFPCWVSSYSNYDVPYNNSNGGNFDNLNDTESVAVCYECQVNDNAVGTFQQYKDLVKNNFYEIVYPENAPTGSAADKSISRFEKLFLATASLWECDPESPITNMDAPLDQKFAERTRSNLLRDASANFIIKNDANLVAEYNASSGEDVVPGTHEGFNTDHYNAMLYAPFDQAWDPIDAGETHYSALTSAQGDGNDKALFAGLDWNFASAYFVLAMLFGMQDSLGKNMNIRTFNQALWYIVFYDMDTGLGLTNSGHETVKKDVYLDRFSMNPNGQEIDVLFNGYTEGGYDTFNSRLWNIIRFLGTRGTTITSLPNIQMNYRTIWEMLRTSGGMLENPESFINDYYIAQNANVGEMLFNFDYEIKYIQSERETINMKADNENSKAVSSIGFLHGDRVNFIKDWFVKHVYFLDGVFDIGAKDRSKSRASELMYGSPAMSDDGIYLPGKVASYQSTDYLSPYAIQTSTQDRSNSGTNMAFVKLKSNYPIFFNFQQTTKRQRIYIPENTEITATLNLPTANEQSLSYNFVPLLTEFDRYGDLCYTTISNPNLASLMKLDLTGMTSLSASKQENFNLNAMRELRELNLEGLTNQQDLYLEVNLSNSPKIKYININRSCINNLVLSGSGSDAMGGSLETLLCENTKLTKLDLTNQTMLQNLNIRDCSMLTSLRLVNNRLLKNVDNIPTSLDTLYIDYAENLESITIRGMKHLGNYSNSNNIESGLRIGYVPSLKSFTYSKSGYDDTAEVTVLDLSGAEKLESISLAGFTGTYVTLAKAAQATLKSVDFNRSNIRYIVWKEGEKSYYSYVGKSDNDSVEGFTNNRVMDLHDCPNLESFNFQNTDTEYVILPYYDNDGNMKVFRSSSLSFMPALRRVFGYINVNDKMQYANQFEINRVARYADMEAGSNEIKTNIVINLDLESDETGGWNTFTVDKSQWETTGEYDIKSIGDDSSEITYYNANNLVTNFKIGMSGALCAVQLFGNTGINVTDMYAVLAKLPRETELLTSTFYGCKNIKTAVGRSTMAYSVEKLPLRSDMFSRIPNVTEMKMTFADCDNIAGEIESWHADVDGNIIGGLFTPLTKLKTLDGTFTGCGKLVIPSRLFAPVAIIHDTNKRRYYVPDEMDGSVYTYYSKVENLINPFSVATEGTETPNLDEFFYYLKNLKVIDGLFASTSINFEAYYDESVSDASCIMLFFNNPRLEQVSNLFPSAKAWTSGSGIAVKWMNLSDAFGGVRRKLNGGHSGWSFEYTIHNDKGMGTVGNPINVVATVGDNTYPRHLTNLSSAFAIGTSNDDQTHAVVDWRNMDYIFWNQTPADPDKPNDLALVSCDNMFEGMWKGIIESDAKSIYATTPDGTAWATFPKDMFNVPNENDGEYSFANLSNMSGLFQKLSFKDAIDFPGDIFRNCTSRNLNISKFLKGTAVTPINLVSVANSSYSCFSNCHLSNVDEMLSECFHELNSNEYKIAYKEYDDNVTQPGLAVVNAISTLIESNPDFAPADIADTSKTAMHYNRYDSGGVRTVIPYKFFYMDGGATISSMKNTFEKCCFSGMRVNPEFHETKPAYGYFASMKPRFHDREMYYITDRPELDELAELAVLESFDAAALKTLVDFDKTVGAYVWDTWSYDGYMLSDEYLSYLTLDLLKKISENAGKESILDEYGKSYLDAKYAAIPDNAEIHIFNDAIANWAATQGLVGNYDYVLEKTADSSILITVTADSSVYTRVYDLIGNAKTKVYDFSVGAAHTDTVFISYDPDYDYKHVNWDDDISGISESGTAVSVWLGNETTYAFENIGGGTTAARDMGYGSRNYTLDETKFVSSYCVPMDIFRYCSTRCDVTGTFKNMSKFRDWDTRNPDDTLYGSMIYGTIGRIPPRLFEPLYQVSAITGTFEGCRGIVPFSQSFDGQLYRNLFRKNGSTISRLVNVFKETTVIGHLTKDLFESNIGLVSLEGLFMSAYMPEDYFANSHIYISKDDAEWNENLSESDSSLMRSPAIKDYMNFLQPGLFDRLNNLTTVSGMFLADQTNPNGNALPINGQIWADITNTLFSQQMNYRLVDVTHLFENQSHINTVSNLANGFIPFHSWTSNPRYDACYRDTNVSIPENLTTEQKDRYKGTFSA